MTLAELVYLVLASVATLAATWEAIGEASR
jgi:hypothetical protein